MVETDNGRGRVLVLGAHGYLGAILSPVIEQSGFELVRQGRARDSQLPLDPTDAVALEGAVRKTRPRFIVNLVAATNVDQCESEPDLAERVNAGVVRNIATAIASSEIRLIQISTDQVYNGRGPHAEEHIDPVNVYARTKRLGEQAALAVGGLVLRVNIVGPSSQPDRVSFSDWLVRQLQSREPLTLFDDVLFSPLEVGDLSVLIARLIDSNISGLYNLGSRDGLSKAEFGIRLAAKLGINGDTIRRGTLADVGLQAPRPTDMRMNCGKFQAGTGIELPAIAETIRQTAVRHAAAIDRNEQYG